MTTTSDAPHPVGLRHRSLKSELIDQIRLDIVQGRLKPGERLIERVLSERYEVSRVPLREAMLRLEAEGFLTLAPRRGATVATFTVEGVEDLFDVREQLEALAARLAAERANPESLAVLGRALSESEEATAADDRERRSSSNAHFHESIIDMAGSPLLSSIMLPIGARVRWLFGFMSSSESPTLLSEHRRLLELIGGGEAAAASEFARAHVAATRKHTLDSLAELIHHG
ncbi:GntR family transcriptional regulator [Microbacterium kribbense]|uniref:GntR family transcriptional regulator n=1 Tax=Microbacterium kribbense TaxID=433645 RepID=A0ABP7GHY9_9MICO